MKTKGIERFYILKVNKAFNADSGGLVPENIWINARTRSYQNSSGEEVVDLIIVTHDEAGCFIGYDTKHGLSWDHLEYADEQEAVS